MVYRKTLLAATIGALAVPAAAFAVPLAVTEVRDDARVALRLEDWTEALAIRADLGDGRLLVELDANTRAVLGAIGAPVRTVDGGTDPRPLYRVAGAGAVERHMIPELGDVIWADEEQVILRTTEPEIWALAGQGVRLQRLPDRAMFPPRPTGALSSAVAPEFPEIDELVGRITGASIAATVDELVAFQTRHSNLQGGLDAQAWLEARFESFGYDQVAELPIDGVMARNVCATLPGEVTPETLYIVGGHYDSTATNTSDAPGADDNASGTAGVLEIAKAMAGMRFESTLVFCGYAAEELGLLGSAAHADALDAAGASVAGMINLDMIGHLADGDAVDIDVAANGTSATMRTLFADVVARYVPGSQQVNGSLPPGASSDHASFWQNGWPALMLFEDTAQYSPYIHTANDTAGLSFNSPDLAERVTRGAAATLAALAVPVQSGTDPEPTPTPPGEDPGTDPADPADDDMETVHGGCMCSMQGTAGGGTGSGSAVGMTMVLVMMVLPLAHRARRRSRTSLGYRGS